MQKRISILVLLVVAAVSAGADEPATRPTTNPALPTLFLVGDSTVHTGTRNQLGWGEPIAKYFDTTRINVINRARGGRSSRTFQTEGLWDKVLSESKPGDYILIQFGHNDGGPLDDTSRARGSIRGTGEESKEIYNPIMKKQEVVHTYGWYMRKYVADAREKKLSLIILSPVPRLPKEPVTGPSTGPTGYGVWAEEVAKAEGVPFIDLGSLILNHYQGPTTRELKEKYFTPADNTHTNPAGADLNASSVVEGIRGLKDHPLAQYLKAP